MCIQNNKYTEYNYRLKVVLKPPHTHLGISITDTVNKEM